MHLPPAALIGFHAVNIPSERRELFKIGGEKSGTHLSENTSAVMERVRYIAQV